MRSLRTPTGRRSAGPLVSLALLSVLVLAVWAVRRHWHGAPDGQPTPGAQAPAPFDQSTRPPPPTHAVDDLRARLGSALALPDRDARRRALESFCEELQAEHLRKIPVLGRVAALPEYGWLLTTPTRGVALASIGWDLYDRYQADDDRRWLDWVLCLPWDTDHGEDLTARWVSSMLEQQVTPEDILARLKQMPAGPAKEFGIFSLLTHAEAPGATLVGAIDDMEHSSYRGQAIATVAIRLLAQGTDAALAWIEGLPEGERGPAWCALGAVLARREPETARQLVERLPVGSRTRKNGLEAVAFSWCCADMAAATQWILSLSPADAEAAAPTVARHWTWEAGGESHVGGKPPDTAVLRKLAAWVQDLPDRARALSCGPLVEAWMRAAPDDVTDWIQALPAGEGRDAAAVAAIRKAKAPCLGIQILCMITAEECLLDCVPQVIRLHENAKDHNRISALLEALPTTCTATQAAKIARAVHRVAPDLTFAWIERLPKSVDRIPALLSSGAQGIQAAKDLAAQQEPGVRRRVDARVVAQELEGNDRLEWLLLATPGEFDVLAPEYAGGEDLDLDWFAKTMPDIPQQALASATEIARWPSSFFTVDLQGDLTAAAELPAGFAFNYAACGALRNGWNRAEDLKATVTEWIRSLDEAAKRDYAVHVYVQRAMLTPENRVMAWEDGIPLENASVFERQHHTIVLPPSEALDWAGTITSNHLRQDTQCSLYCRWHATERTAAEAWLKSADLSDDMKAEFEAVAGLGREGW